jgi:ferritin-like metal-binding protein YciE
MDSGAKSVNETIADWVGDIVALESHVEEALDHQLEITSTNASLKSTIQTFHDTVKASKDRAVAYQEQYGSTPASGVLKTGAELLGKAAGLIDKLRKDTIAKALRDDYTAFNHVAIAYTMLHTTAMALGDSATEAFAEQGLRTYAGMVQEINSVMPQAVVEDLKDNGDVPSIDASIVDGCRAKIDSIWKATN